jgi:predicted TIM-barrel fold metal-dependent hydrolase
MSLIIDHQWHWLPPEALALLGERKAPPRAERDNEGWMLEVAPGYVTALPPAILDLDEQLALARSYGIDVVVVDANFPGEALHLPRDEAVELILCTNEAVAAAQRAHADRIVGLALLPLQYPDAAIAVLERAVADELRGVAMLASIDGEPIATEQTMPVFRRIEELGLPIVLHPALRSSTRAMKFGPFAEVGLGWMYHSSLAALNMIDAGVFEACPNLTVLHPHLGGVLPYVLGRLDRLPLAKHSVADTLRRNFYVDTVSATPGALPIAIDTYGLDRIVFGTDFPFVPIEASFAYVRKHPQANTIFANTVPGLLP